MSTGDKTRVTVNIYGTQYKLMGDANTEPTHMQMVAALVDERMKKIAESNPRLDLPRIAVLSAVNLADEMKRMSKEYELDQQVEKKQKEQIEREVEQLKLENTRLQQELKLQQEWYETVQQQNETLQNELAELEKKNSELQRNYKLEIERLQQEEQKDESIYEAYDQLQKEYKKLQTEYNEWIELVEKNE